MREKTVFARSFMDDLEDSGRWQIAIVGPRGGRRGFLMTGDTGPKAERFVKRARFGSRKAAKFWARWFTRLWAPTNRYMEQRVSR